MSEAVEWRLARLYSTISYFIALFAAVMGLAMFSVGSVAGGVAGAVMALYGVVLLFAAIWAMLYNWGKRRSGYVRSFCDRVPKLGGYDQRALDEWCDELEDSGAFHGERE